MIAAIVGHVVKQLVDKPEVVKVTEINEGSKVIVEIYVDSQDMKRVIGKEGRVIRAIRALVNCFPPHDKDVVLEVAS